MQAGVPMRASRVSRSVKALVSGSPGSRLRQQLFPAEQCRPAQLLIERVVIADGGLEIIWRDQGWHELAGELLPGTIGAEVQEWEQQGVEA
ncbi:hypothetical protein [Thiocapsa sp. UBA6158]|uniref:hypothetical protein n=1 Tax=Thiocapsa sp. UBA6158 TaxID=1947692 RepID=UPI0025DC09FA|nr:hypothetical protein [Thiocapsa sp. UBA6158]